MALFPCTECGREISDKAASCPHCGCPVGPPAVALPIVAPPIVELPVAEPRPEPKKELFEIVDHRGIRPRKSSFVLSEVIGMYEYGFRRWVVVLVALATVAGFVALAMAGVPSGWAIAVLIIGGLACIGLLSKWKGLATTGGMEEFQAPFAPLVKDYCNRVPSSVLVRYTAPHPVLTTHWVINADRVASFTVSIDYTFITWYVVALVPFLIRQATASDVSQVVSTALLLLSLGFVAMGVLSRRSTIKVVGVGGHTVSLHTYQRDSSRVQAELRSKITAQTR